VSQGPARRRRPRGGRPAVTPAAQWLRRLVAGPVAVALAVTLAAWPGSVPAWAQRGGPGRGRPAARALTSGAITSPGRARAATSSGRTVVSLTFDDGDADQLIAARILHRYGLPATFYVITGAVGAPGYLTVRQLRGLAAQGDEIGAHTVSHLELTGIPLAEARRQACVSRAVLTRWGFRVRSFAYPGGAVSRQAEAIVRGCGFDSARGTTGLRSGGCPRCRATETVPPAAPMAIRTPGQVDRSWTLADLEGLVRRAERSGGGWLPLIFHHICTANRCEALSFPARLLDAFARWLARRGPGGTVVRTVSQVTGGPDRRTPRVPPARPHGVVNPSLERAGRSGSVSPQIEAAGQGPLVPRCWMLGGYGRNTARWQRVRDARSGRWAERLVITGYHSGDAKLLPRFDLGQCSLPVQPGRSYLLSSWYQSSARVQYAVYYRTWPGRWVYWTSSPFLPASAGWAEAPWTTPPLPAGASGLSFGLALAHRGWLVTDSYRFGPAPPDVARELADYLVLAALAAAAGLGVARRYRRRRRRDRPPGPESASGPGQPARPGGTRLSSSSP
jgi:peptidoglycan/xylan/chitin deacetylase (PgdA/CDA1 family)